MARLLRAAPHLRHLTFHTDDWRYVHWLLANEFHSESGLVHPRLRHVAFTSEHVPAHLMPRVCGDQLRQRNFPCLRRLTVDDEEYPVWAPRRMAF
jgi:hypothetical protein